jgi:hypothetical protein
MSFVVDAIDRRWLALRWKMMSPVAGSTRTAAGASMAGRPGGSAACAATGRAAGSSSAATSRTSSSGSAAAADARERRPATRGA